MNEIITAQSDPAQFDRFKANRVADEMLLLLAGFLPAGSDIWLRENRPDVFSNLEMAHREVKSAILDDNYHRFVASVKNCAAKFLQAEKVYQDESSRPRRLTCSGSHQDCTEAGVN